MPPLSSPSMLRPHKTGNNLSPRHLPPSTGTRASGLRNGLIDLFTGRCQQLNILCHFQCTRPTETADPIERSTEGRFGDTGCGPVQFPSVGTPVSTRAAPRENPQPGWPESSRKAHPGSAWGINSFQSRAACIPGLPHREAFFPALLTCHPASPLSPEVRPRLSGRTSPGHPVCLPLPESSGSFTGSVDGGGGMTFPQSWLSRLPAAGPWASHAPTHLSWQLPPELQPPSSQDCGRS